MERIIIILFIAFLVGGMVLTGLKKLAPTYYLEIFFFIAMLLINVVTIPFALLVGALAGDDGTSEYAGAIGFLAVEGFPFLLLILSLYLLGRKVMSK
ncbi:hypothetical protein [Ureibacillus aquaedulcis]|uniref:Uncharacterized protein n=1 Tax=Ureibacillus aquaedulcis TaxID=3058421 RepID=A0ABT8GNI3_9BACL|nr:hypothetical protein [Ureibacillus sp. BA0131]MDN4492978.1 hypothetical protein [Ureibacillus sp. BA0131]